MTDEQHERMAHVFELEHMTVVMGEDNIRVTNKATGSTDVVTVQKLETMIEALSFVLTCEPTTAEEAEKYVPVPGGWEFDIGQDGMVHLKVYDRDAKLVIDDASPRIMAETYLAELREMYNMYETLYL